MGNGLGIFGMSDEYHALSSEAEYLKMGMGGCEMALSSLDEFARRYDAIETLMRKSNFPSLLSKEGKEEMVSAIGQLRPVYDLYCEIARRKNE